MMRRLTYWLALAGVKSLQALPLPWVARLGRWGGGLAYFLDARHRRVAKSNLTAAFGGEKSVREIDALNREHFRRLGENYASSIKTSDMSSRELADHLTVVGAEKLRHRDIPSRNRVFAVGHFGNFELYARANLSVEPYQFATTYRGLNNPELDRLLGRLRANSGCLYFERRFDGAELRSAMAGKSVMLGLFSDQHAGGGGVWIPFLGRVCSTNTSAAVFAQRYKLPLHTAVCFRTGLARWRIEIGDEIPTFDAQSRRRPTAHIMAEVNRVFEHAVRRDPANWFWVHNRWKPRKPPSSRRKKPRHAHEALAQP